MQARLPGNQSCTKMFAKTKGEDGGTKYFLNHSCRIRFAKKRKGEMEELYCCLKS